jgi:hypothetical protein
VTRVEHGGEPDGDEELRLLGEPPDRGRGSERAGRGRGPSDDSAYSDERDDELEDPDDDPFDAPGQWRSVSESRLSMRGLVIVALVALVPVVSAIGIALLLSLGTGQPATGADGGTATGAGGGSDGGSGASGGSGGATSGSDNGAGNGSDNGNGGSDGGVPSGGAVQSAKRDDGAKALRKAGIRRIGAVEGAWTWRDGNTVTMLVVSRRVTTRNSNFSARAVTLRATAVVDPDGAAKALATVEDPGQTCERGVEMKADVLAKDVAVRDLDGDGTREVLVGWSHACGNDARRQATVLSGAGGFALAGQGAAIAEPDPPITDWPDGFVDAASQALDKVG